MKKEMLVDQEGAKKFFGGAALKALVPGEEPKWTIPEGFKVKQNKIPSDLVGDYLGTVDDYPVSYENSESADFLHYIVYGKSRRGTILARFLSQEDMEYLMRRELEPIEKYKHMRTMP